VFLKIATLYCKKNYQNILSRTGFIKVLAREPTSVPLQFNLRVSQKTKIGRFSPQNEEKRLYQKKNTVSF
jgi:hypothetical protein